MKIVIDIPKDFEKHFNEDRFKDSLERIECDIQDDINEDHTIPMVSGLWELELIDMLIEAFKNAESVKCGKWIWVENYRDCEGDIYSKYKCSCCDFSVSGIYSAEDLTLFCGNCGAKMDGD